MGAQLSRGSLERGSAVASVCVCQARQLDPHEVSFEVIRDKCDDLSI